VLARSSSSSRSSSRSRAASSLTRAVSAAAASAAPLRGLGFPPLSCGFGQRGVSSRFRGPDVVVAFSLGSSDALFGLAADPLDLCGVGDDGFREPVVGLAGLVLRDGQPLAFAVGGHRASPTPHVPT
jgi:hypothetical protein